MGVREGVVFYDNLNRGPCFNEVIWLRFVRLFNKEFRA